MLFFFLSEISFYRFLRMRDFDFTKAKDAFLSYLKWREDYMVDAIPKVKDFELYFPTDTEDNDIFHIGFTA